MSEYDRFSDRTRNLIAALIALCVLVAIGALTYGAVTADQRSTDSKNACISEGGVFANGVCSWSRPGVTVEEDGSIDGYGCLIGYPCDDTARKP
jgi:hypothetical protein